MDTELDNIWIRPSDDGGTLFQIPLLALIERDHRIVGSPFEHVLEDDDLPPIGSGIAGGLGTGTVTTTAPVLLGRAGACFSAGVDEQHEREQPGDLAVAGEQPM